MEPLYTNLSEEKRDAAQAYAAKHGLAFESGADEEEGKFYVMPMTGDEGAPQWTGEHISALEALLAE